MRYSSFDRARRFGRRAVGIPLGVYISGVAAAVVLALLVLLVPLLAELLATAGTLTVGLTDQAYFDELGVGPDAVNGKTATYEHRGLLPTVWRLRESWLEPLYRTAYSWSAIRANHTCLLALIGSAWLLTLLAVASLVWLEISVQKAALRTATAIRSQIHDQAHRLGAGDLFLGQPSASAELFTVKTNALRRGLAAWWRFVPHAAVFLAAMFALALSVDFWLTLATLLLTGLIGWMLYEIRSRARQKEARLADTSRHLLALPLEHLQQSRVFANLTSDWTADRRTFDEDLQRYDQTVLAQEKTASILKPMVALFALLGVELVLLLAGFNVLNEPARVSLPEAVLLGTALCAMAYPLFRFERFLEALSPAEQAASQIFVYLDREPRTGQMPQAAPLERLARQISFDHVTLANLSGRLLLNDVSFSLPASSQTVIFCANDATPRAVAALLARFCDPAAGRVLFDGGDLSQVTLDSVRRQVVLILADNLLLSGSLRQNIVGDDTRFTAAEIIEALKAVHAYEFVQPLPEGLETAIGLHGQTLSSGQAIRLGLARVALWNPAVLVIEEPSDDLDQVTAERVADALDRVSQGRTVVILARRLATLRAAQRILLFHEGALLADGAHQELLQQNEMYRHLNYVRFNEFRDTVR